MAVVAFCFEYLDRNRNYAKMERQSNRHMYVLLSEEVHQPPFGRTLIDIAGIFIIGNRRRIVNNRQTEYRNVSKTVKSANVGAIR